MQRQEASKAEAMSKQAPALRQHSLTVRQGDESMFTTQLTDMLNQELWVGAMLVVVDERLYMLQVISVYHSDLSVSPHTFFHMYPQKTAGSLGPSF